MKKFIPFIILLAGCAKETPASQEMANNAVDTITAIHQSLPTECRTDSNELLFQVAKREVKAVAAQCTAEKQHIEHEKLRWKFATFGLVIAIVAYIVRKLMK